MQSNVEGAVDGGHAADGKETDHLVTTSNDQPRRQPSRAFGGARSRVLRHTR